MKLVDGVRTHHVHAVPRDSDFLERHVLFRDYLRAHPDVARDYLHLKRRMAERYREDHEAYTEAKTDFMHAVERKARACLASRRVTAPLAQADQPGV